MKVRVHSGDHKLLKELAITTSMSIADVVRSIINGKVSKKAIKKIRTQIKHQEEKERQFKIDRLNENIIEEEDLSIEEYQRMDREMIKNSFKIVK